MLIVPETLVSVNAEILPHGAKEIDTGLILGDLIVHGHEAGQDGFGRRLCGLAAGGKLLAQLGCIKAEQRIGFVGGRGGILGADAEFLHCIAQLVDREGAGGGAVFKRGKKFVRRVAHLAIMDGILVDDVHQVAVFVKALLRTLHDQRVGLIGGDAKLRHEHVDGAQAFGRVKAEGVTQREGALGELTELVGVGLMGALRDLRHGRGDVIEVLAIAAGVDGIHRSLKAAHFLVRCAGLRLYRCKRGVVVERGGDGRADRRTDRTGGDCEILSGVLDFPLCVVIGFLQVVHGLGQLLGVFGCFGGLFSGILDGVSCIRQGLVGLLGLPLQLCEILLGEEHFTLQMAILFIACIAVLELFGGFFLRLAQNVHLFF